MAQRRIEPKSSKNSAGSDMDDASGQGSATSDRRSPYSWYMLLALVLMLAGIFFRFSKQQPSGFDSELSDNPLAQKVAGSINEQLAGLNPTLLNTASIKQERETIKANLDPSLDGWETEVVAESAKKQLKKICGRLSDQESGDKLTKSISDSISFSALRPDGLEEVYRSGKASEQIVIQRDAAGKGAELEFHGREEFLIAIDKLAKPHDGMGNIHIHLKVIHVSSSRESAKTTILVETDSHSGNRKVQQRATWHCQWKRMPNAELQLTSLRAEDYEEAISEGPWLVDCTRAVLDSNDAFNRQLLYGLNHWLGRLEKVHGIHVYARNGLTVGDVNGDGLDDVYICQPGGLPNRLFVQQEDGTAVDRSHESGVDWLDQTSSALLIDLDNDGDQDLVAATVSGLLVMENDSAGKFHLKKTLATNDTDTQSFSAADYDNDGDLDLFVCIEFAKQLTLQYQSDISFVYHDANDGAANVLFRNDIEGDDWQFSDVTKQSGLDVNNRRHSLACAWEDFDNDGDQDLYVANDYGHNCLFENTNGKFKDIAEEVNALDTASGMSVSWGDFNCDGWMDLYVANMFSSAGNRITNQQQFKSGVDDQMRSIYSRFAKGNTLLQNDGTGQFKDVGAEAGVEMGRWAWSSVFADLNNDSWEDLLVANGYITTEDTGDL